MRRRVYGGQEFALAFGGNEMPGYHTGPARAPGHSDRRAAQPPGQRRLQRRPEDARQEADPAGRTRRDLPGRGALAAGALEPGGVLLCPRHLPAGTGRPRAPGGGLRPSADDLPCIGKAIHREKYRFKIREGFSPDELRLPKRIFQTPSLVRDWDEATCARRWSVSATPWQRGRAAKKKEGDT